MWYNVRYKKSLGDLLMKKKIKNRLGSSIEQLINEWGSDINLLHGRYKSWEHCYNKFNKWDDVDNLAINLGFYLASWGMYRGSSFLLYNDYTVLNKIVEICKRYKNLRNLKIQNYTYKVIENIFNVAREIKEELQNIKKETPKYDRDISESDMITQTLITKIILGVFGCVPAYDRYACRALKSIKLSDKFNINNFENFKKLVDYFAGYKDIFNNLRANKKFKNYTDMKFIDMYLFQKGIDLEKNKK